MTCCEKCIGVSPIRGVVCNNKLCPCHSKDDGLERVIREFDKKFLYKLNQIALAHLYVELYADQLEFITQVYKEAYTKGEKEGQARMDNSGRLLFQQGVESERERIRKELPKPLTGKYLTGTYGTIREKKLSNLKGFNNCLDQVKKII